LIALLLLAGAVQGGNKDYHSPEQVEGTLTVDLAEAKRLHEAGVTFIDVRNPRLYARRHIPGAVHLDLKDRYTEETLAEVVDKAEPFVVYCSGVTCSRSYRAAARAVKWGYTRVYYFRGGVVDWRDAGLPLDKVTMPSG
jgi:rhodanese-related sulfurtransferase